MKDLEQASGVLHHACGMVLDSFANFIVWQLKITWYFCNKRCCNKPEKEEVCFTYCL